MARATVLQKAAIVEAVEALRRRELRRLDPALDHPPFAINQLQFREPFEIGKRPLCPTLGGWAEPVTLSSRSIPVDKSGQ